MFTIDNTAFVLIDVQGKLATLMHEKDALFDNLVRLTRGILALKIPILWTEQIPEKLGPTIPELTALLSGVEPLPKSSFSCCGDPAFNDRLKALDRGQVLLAGIESHVCVYQTAAHLRERGYEVQVAADAVSSRTRSNRRIGLERMRAAGAELTSVESALFELMQDAKHPAFREVVAAVK